MKLSAVWASFLKELRLLVRDVHGLALLFALPLAFILVMSLALADLFEARAGKGLGVLLIDRDRGAYAQVLHEKLASISAYTVTRSETPLDAEALRRTLRDGVYSFAVEIAPDYSQRLGVTANAQSQKPLVTVTAAADTGKQTEFLFVSALREALERQRGELLLKQIGVSMPPGEEEASKTRIAVAYAYPRADTRGGPNAVQQNVPGWLVFAMFFIAVPFSNSFIRERQFGVLRRLKTTNIGPAAQFFGKLAPYFVVNQIQVVLMLTTGAVLVPLIGGDALAINGSPPALVLLSAALSFAALGLALLIAVIAKSTEQASLLAGLGNLVLAAVGGILVPAFVMPEAMRTIASFSPMAWGLEGFLDLLLRGGGVSDIADDVAKLGAFGATTLALAWVLYRPQE